MTKLATTLGELKKSGYKSKSIKEEIRQNLIRKLQNKEETFPGSCAAVQACRGQENTARWWSVRQDPRGVLL